MMALMPNRKGLASAIAHLGVTFTPMLMGYLSQYVMNPDLMKPTYVIREGHRKIKVFDHKITMKVQDFVI
jgi:hypothetical protein